MDTVDDYTAQTNLKRTPEARLLLTVLKTFYFGPVLGVLFSGHLYAVEVPSQFAPAVDPDSLATPLEREVLPYAITSPNGGVIYSIDPKTAYDGLRRGTIDVEPMDEVKAHALPSTLPDAIVVPAAKREYYVELQRLEKEGPPLQGEDKVFRQIRLDQERERCLFYGEECSLIEVLEPVE